MGGWVVEGRSFNWMIGGVGVEEEAGWVVVHQGKGGLRGWCSGGAVHAGMWCGEESDRVKEREREPCKGGS